MAGHSTPCDQIIIRSLHHLKKVEVAPIAEVSVPMAYKTQMIQVGSNLNSFFLWLSFYGSSKYYAVHQQREAIKQSYRTATSVSHAN